MTASLSQKDVQALPSASSKGILVHAAWVRRYVESERWLGRRNAYQLDAVQRIQDDVKGKSVQVPKHLGEYIAASIPLHLMDAWGYLGQAMSAQVKGLPEVSTHLAYYAELRAAMSLLASQGIGVFNKSHFVVEESGTLVQLSERTTHQAVWLYLEHWAGSQAAGDLLGQVIRPHGVPISAWVAEMSNSGSWLPIGEDLLLRMGLDLARMAEDRSARNEVSYRPTGIGQGTQLPAVARAEFLSRSLRILEPSGTGGSFDALDTQMLRETLKVAFKAITNRTPLQAPKRFEDALLRTVSSNIGSGPAAAQLQEFLGQAVDSDSSMVVQEAAGREISTHPRHHLQVLSRAVLLLRVATGAAREFLVDADLGVESHPFWWAERGYGQGLWDSLEPEDIADVWLDIADALDEIEQWCETPGPPLQLLRECARSLQDATGLSRIALLGLAS